MRFNDLPPRRPAKEGAPLRLANAGGALVTAAFAVFSVQRPTFVSPGQQTGPLVAFWSQAAAARTLPLTCVLLTELARDRPLRLCPLLLVAGLVQAGDAALGVRQRNLGMTLVSAGLAALHLITAQRVQAS